MNNIIMNANTCSMINPLVTRRDVLQLTACGFGWLAFTTLANSQASYALSLDKKETPLAPKKIPLKQRAKRVIFLCMSGAPSHVDLLDYKPKLNRDSGKPGPRAGTQWLGSKWKFNQHGQSGLWMSELLPNLAKHADKLCVVSSMQTDLPAHPQAFIKLHTGTAQFVRPSLGAWTLYGKGTSSTIDFHDDLIGQFKRTKFFVITHLSTLLQKGNQKLKTKVYGLKAPEGR